MFMLLLFLVGLLSSNGDRFAFIAVYRLKWYMASMKLCSSFYLLNMARTDHC